MVSKQYLIRNWVQYLKNNNIVSSNVSQGGSLTYRRRPTKSDYRNGVQTRPDTKATYARVGRAGAVPTFDTVRGNGVVRETANYGGRIAH